MSKYSKMPELNASVFDCPHCKCTARFEWTHLSGRRGNVTFIGERLYNSVPRKSTNSDSNKKVEQGNKEGEWEIHIGVCTICHEFVLWKDENIIFPNKHGVDDPNPDMPEEVSDLYKEARSVVQLSPKSACALLRLALQKLLIELKCPKNNRIVDNIDLLKKRNEINDVVFDALDAVRVVGNNAVHPGKINIDDNPKIAVTLFWLLNFIVEELISKPAKVSDFRKSLR
ncbi:DUF4145 domain-containing protein [Bacillus anthracis]|uniref:DUF4145 domain-containing protein n=1 Tax=Bacillus anthracis TaxID=1392 RepID=UPI002DBBAF38|nr:DUF4145 domain-containing protein [Bacillus anthracis]MEB9454425.1 DUF4145 domain-containing protein [Bacillus anthracis]